MKTKFVVCSLPDQVLQGVFIISNYYKQYPVQDGHKIFLVNRGNFCQVTNFSNELTPDDEREIIFCMQDVVDSLSPRKDVVSQISISKISQGRNAEYHCQNLIEWLLCRADS